MDEQSIEPRTIKVLGSIETSYDIERYRDFICYGRKNIDDVCGACTLRFTCFSTREDIEIPVKEFGKASIKDVTVKMIANKFSALRYKFVSHLNENSRQYSKPDRVQINYKKVVKKNDV